MGFEPNHREVVANRKLGTVPDGFVWCGWEALDDGGVLMEGCTSSGIHTSGKRKGTPKYDGPIKKVVVTEDEHRAERARYEAETGNCARCGGDGSMWHGWNHETGHKFIPCTSCGATGKAKAVA